jgi:hypothetical protein
LLLATGVALRPDLASADLSGRDKREIKTQLENSARYIRLALERIEDTHAALGLTWQAYVQLRAAHTRVLNAIEEKNLKFLLIMYEAAAPRLQKARDRLLEARSVLKHPSYADAVGDTPAGLASKHLHQALKEIELVLLTTL